MARHRLKILAALGGVVIVLTALHPAFAQRGRGGFRRLFGVAKAQLATLPEVQTELEMTDEQKTRVAEINDKLGEDRRALWGTGFGRASEIRGEAERLDQEASKSIDDVLEPAQRKRLQEITIQQNGPRALQDPSVITELGFTDEQKSNLLAARDENAKAFEKAFEESGWENWRERAGELADEADKRLLGVLSDEQEKMFEQLKGEEFDVDLSPLFRRGRGRGPR